MFANVVLILFLSVSLVIFGFLVVLIRQIKKDGKLSQEKLTRLAVLLFIPAIIVFALVLYGISSWRTDIKYQENQKEITQFVKGVYKPLADSQQALLESINHLRKLEEDIEPLLYQHANHAELLKDITIEWRNSQQTLYSLYTETDKEIRHAWISYKTLDKKDVLDKFYTKSVNLNNKITKLNKDYQVGVRGAKDKLVNSLNVATKTLYEKNKKKVRDKAAKNNSKDTQKKLQINDFRENIIATLLGFLSRMDAGLVTEVERIREDILIAAQRHEEVRLYLKDNPDLQEPLDKVLEAWVQLQTTNRNDLNRIFYAIEAEYLARKLGLTKNHPSIKALHKSLKLRIPAIASKAQKQKDNLERSYNIK